MPPFVGSAVSEKCHLHKASYYVGRLVAKISTDEQWCDYKTRICVPQSSHIPPDACLGRCPRCTINCANITFLTGVSAPAPYGKNLIAQAKLQCRFPPSNHRFHLQGSCPGRYIRELVSTVYGTDEVLVHFNMSAIFSDQRSPCAVDTCSPFTPRQLHQSDG